MDSEQERALEEPTTPVSDELPLADAQQDESPLADAQQDESPLADAQQDETETQTLFFADTTLDEDPVEKLDKLIDETAENYLKDLISHLAEYPRPKTFAQKITQAALVSVGAVVTFSAVLAISYSISHLPLRSHFLGVDTSNVLPQTAYEQIQNQIGPILNNPITIKTATSNSQFTPEQLGVSLDLVATLQQAPKNPFSAIYSLVVPIGIAPVFKTDENKFKTALATIAAAQESSPQVAGISIVGDQINTSRQSNGLVANWDKTINSVQMNWLRNNQPLAIVFDEVEPEITDAKVNLLAQSAAAMLAQPVKIRFNNEVKAFEPRDIGDSIFIQQNSGELNLELNSNILWNKLANKFSGINQPVKNAKLEIIDDVPVISPANTALNINSDAFKELFQAQLVNSNDRLIDLTSNQIEPSVSTQELQALGIVEKVSEFRQPFPPAQYRTLNVGNAAKFIDNKIISPGEIYSMNDTIKERTEENGYVPGIFISNGRFEEGYGGGVSIITTALWTAAFFAGLEAVEQRAHSIYIPRYQEGIEATVQWGSLDLKFKNTLDHAIMFKTQVDADGVVISIYGTKKYDQVIAKKTNRYSVREYKTVYSESRDCIEQEGQPGFGVTVTRELIKAGEIVQSDIFKTSYRVGNEVICGPNPKKQDEPAALVEGELVTAAE
jgi:vancomycin resistance protein YoaR